MKNINNYDNLEESWPRKCIQVFIKCKNQIICEDLILCFSGSMTMSVYWFVCFIYIWTFPYSYFCYKMFAATITYNKRSSCQKLACLYVYKSQVIHSHSFNQVLIRRRLTLSTHVRIHEMNYFQYLRNILGDCVKYF